MNDPVERYDPDYYGDMRYFKNGDWVEYADYKKLEAENNRLKGIILAQSSDFVRSKTSEDGIKPEGHNDLAGRAVERCLELQIEVERLRKAIHGFLSVNPKTSNPCGCGFWTCETKDLIELNNALEGKQP